jgi:hypothetical protein
MTNKKQIDLLKIEIDLLLKKVELLERIRSVQTKTIVELKQSIAVLDDTVATQRLTITNMTAILRLRGIDIDADIVKAASN